jgi:hypothetical protein
MKTNRNYHALGDIGFLGIPNKKHSEKYFAEIGVAIAEMRKKQKSSRRKSCSKIPNFRQNLE